MNTWEMLIERNGALEFFDCFRQKSCLPVGPTKDDVKLWPFAESRKHSIVNLLRRIELSLLEVNQSKCVRDVIVVGCELQRGLEFLCGFAKLSKHEIALADHVVSAGVLKVVGPNLS